MTTRVGSRRSGITAASFSAIPIRRAASASNITPPSDDNRPPSKAAVSFFPRTAGNQNGRVVSSDMAGSQRSMWAPEHGSSGHRRNRSFHHPKRSVSTGKRIICKVASSRSSIIETIRVDRGTVATTSRSSPTTKMSI